MCIASTARHTQAHCQSSLHDGTLQMHGFFLASGSPAAGELLHLQLSVLVQQALLAGSQALRGGIQPLIASTVDVLLYWALLAVQRAALCCKLPDLQTYRTWSLWR